MLDFIFILLFGKTVLLTNIPVDIQDTSSISLEKPISALTPGASIQIDVSSMIKYEPKSNIADFRKKIEEMFPPQSIQATLVSIGGENVILKYNGASMFNEKQVLISLYSDIGVPKSTEFNRIQISSATKLRSVKLLWMNYKK